jgi:uncharacterized protein involved in outer membrane biogenesis
VRQRVIEALEQRFDAEVELKWLQVSLFPQPSAIGEGLTIRHRQWRDAHALISIRRFSARSDFSTLLDRRNHVDQLRLEGMEIHIPPRGHASEKDIQEGQAEVANAEPGRDTTRLKFFIEKIDADGTLLEIEPKVEGTRPLSFDIEK